MGQHGTGRRRAAALALGLMMAPAFGIGAAQADAMATYRDAGRGLFSFQVPDFWTMEVAGARHLTLPGGDDVRPVAQVLAIQPQVDPTVWMGFISPPGVRTLEDGRTYLRDAAQQLAFDPVPAPPQSRRVNGRDAELFTGTGNRRGQAIQYAILMVQLPGNRVAIAASVIEAGTDAAFFDEINEVLTSIRAAGG